MDVAGLAEVTKRNSGTGHIHGIEVEAQAALTGNLSVRGVFSWMEGRLKSYPTAAPVLVEEPVSRLMPRDVQRHAFVGKRRRGHSARPSRWRRRRTSLRRRIASTSSGYRPAARLDMRCMDFTPDGEQARGSRFSAAIENLSNEDYRVHGSGLNEPGRNFVLTARTEF